ncbi:Putative ribonuclease H protein At1g65750 [Linum perenne]
MNDELGRPVTNDEIRLAVFSLGATQSPGPDGYNGHFYRRYWPLIGPQLCQEISRFFQTNDMPEGWNDTHIILIPKIPNPKSMNNFRPISCCNFNYKIISKILSNRLKKWIPSLVPETQTPFTSGRAIQDNVIIVHEVLHSFKTRVSNCKDMCLKLDMRKAYDMVDWDCLDNLLKAYGFSETWCGWIRSCIRTVRFSVMLNGRALDAFQPSRGIRQGDPLSPFLFILMTNALSFLIDRSVSRKELHGIRLNKRGPLLTHCLFADDTIVFGKASPTELIQILSIFHNYGRVTGQEINPAKSFIFFSKNVEATTKTDILSIMGCQMGNSKYLGVPTEWGRSRKETFNFLIQRMEKVTQTWKSSILSHAGKEVMLKAVVQAIPSYIMGLFLLPKTTTNKMNAMLRNFFWSGSTNKRSIHWSHADVLCAPKQEGGLGFRDFATFNRALLAKLAWRLLTTSTATWACLLKSRYFHKTSFLQAKKGARPSWIWASLCDAKEILNLGTIRVIGNGTSTSISRDPWIPGLPNFRCGGDPVQCDPVSNWILSNPRRWDLNTIGRSCNGDQTHSISTIPIGPPDLEDNWKWKFTTDGSFSVKSAYHAGRKHQTNLRGPRRSLRTINAKQWNWLWNLSLPPKIRFFIWKCVQGILPTQSNLHRRRCSTNPTCQVCNEQEESILHCIFFCPHASRAWRLSCPSTSLPPTNNSFAEWFFPMQEETGTEGLRRIAATCWNIWKARNAVIFRNTMTNDSTTKDAIELDTAEWSSQPRPQEDPITTAHHPINLPSRPQIPPHRQQTYPPPRAQLRVYCDASFQDSSQMAAFGIVVINSEGQVCDGRSGRFPSASPIASEARALLEATKYAKSSPLQCVIFSDCKTLVDSIKGPERLWPWDCYGTLGYISRIRRSCPFISFQFIRRRLNSQADWVAKHTRQGTLPPDWVDTIPRLL